MAEKNNTTIPEISGTLRAFRLNVPAEIAACNGIRIFGRVIRSVLFSTDACIIANSNADAVIAVYPFTPQPVITAAVMKVAGVPVFVGVGGGLTKGPRVVNLALHAEFQGAYGVVVNAPTSNEVVRELKGTVDIPVVVTVLSESEDIEARFHAGADILNISAAAKTPEVVRAVRVRYPDAPIIATGGPTPESIRATVEAGANCITWTPPANGDVFKGIMDAYRQGLPHP
ncbi:MAG: hydrolase [Oscillospiraceae bacterium]|nr:hydrolase [Oscillospiraceae bacterium]